MMQCGKHIWNSSCCGYNMQIKNAGFHHPKRKEIYGKVVMTWKFYVSFDSSYEASLQREWKRMHAMPRGFRFWHSQPPVRVMPPFSW